MNIIKSLQSAGNSVSRSVVKVGKNIDVNARIVKSSVEANVAQRKVAALKAERRKLNKNSTSLLSRFF